ncbi:hypothetical protein C8J56DRAFT_596648 [Mycena floridula]|nr:hypothetical protein C8J56DRAFT_596648 [Mycena floridula]
MIIHSFSKTPIVCHSDAAATSFSSQTMVSLFESAAPQPQVETSLSSAYDQLPAAILLDSLIQSFLLGFVLGQAVKYWRFWRGFMAQTGLCHRHRLAFIQTFLQNLKVWRVAIQHQGWTASFWVWLNLPTTGSVSLLCEAFFIRRCWQMMNRSKRVLYPMVFMLVVIACAIILPAMRFISPLLHSI